MEKEPNGDQIQENKEGLNHTKTKAGSNQQQNIVSVKTLLKHLFLFECHLSFVNLLYLENEFRAG